MMKNNIFLIIIMLLTLSSAACRAQKDTLTLQVEHRDRPSKGEPIRYYFPGPVDSVAQILMAASECSSFIIKMSDSENVRLSFTCDHDLDGQFENQSVLVSSSNRFYAINDIHIPIYFSTDNKFSFAQFTYTGGDFLIIFDSQASHLGKVIKICVANEHWNKLDESRRHKLFSLSENKIELW